MPNSHENEQDSSIRFDLNGKQIRRSVPDSCQDARHVSINFGSLLPMLEEAIASRRVWVRDFADEEIRVSADLFDVIQAFRYFNHE